MSSSNSPCAACKLLRRKCTQECVFAPYFQPDQPQKFANVHKVFGASNVAKLLNDLPAVQREDAVNSLAYEADARLRDPIYGCVGLISILQHKLKQVQMDLFNAKKELSTYIGPSAMLPILPAAGNFIPPYQQQSSQMMPYNMQSAQMMGGSPHNVANPGPLAIQQQHNYQQIMEAQQVAAVVAAAREQEMLRNYEQQQAVLTQQQGRQSDHMRYDLTGQGPDHIQGSVFNHMSVSAGMAPALVLGSFEGPYQTQEHKQNDQPHHQFLATQTLLEEHQQQQGLALAQPQQLDSTQQQQGLALLQPQQLDRQQQQLPPQQHRDGSEEEE